MSDHDARQTEREALGWFGWCFWGMLGSALLWGIVQGHAWVSAGMIR